MTGAPRRARRSRTVYEARSPLSGRIRVIDHRHERRLVVGGSVLSVYPLDGDWAPVRREYWWRAIVARPLPPRPSALLVGLGGGTQIHLLAAVAGARRFTVIERDPVIIDVANRCFGLTTLGPIEFLCADAEVAIPALHRARRRFDFVMEDAAYGEDVERSIALARALAPLTAPRGVLVVNRHLRADVGPLVRALTPLFGELRVRRVRREAENVLVCCAEPLRRRNGRAPA